MNFLDNYYTVGSKIRSTEARREYYAAVIEFYYTGEEPVFDSETAEIGFAGVLYSLKKARAGKLGGEASSASPSAPQAKRQQEANQATTKYEQEEEEEEIVSTNVDTAPKAPKAEVREILDYLNAKTGKSFRASSESTTRKVAARLKEGYTVDDFKRVIDNKVADWANDGSMAKYLRPETLFGTKFEAYLNEGRVRNGGNRCAPADYDW